MTTNWEGCIASMPKKDFALAENQPQKHIKIYLQVEPSHFTLQTQWKILKGENGFTEVHG